MREQKTNAMRVFDAAGIPYTTYSIETDTALSGTDVAKQLGIDGNRIFKTLVTQARSGSYYVFMIPVSQELDLKKAAEAIDEKSIAMIRSKELFNLTGYVHGGCSPVGMKKFFTTTIDETAMLYDSIIFSAGRIGFQIELPLSDLQKVIPLKTADLTSGI